MRRIRIDRLREEAENKDNDAVTNTEGIEKDAPDTRDVKGAPDEFIGLPRGARHLVGVFNGSSYAMPEKKSLGEDVRGVEAADANGDDIVESSCRADVDQTNGAGNGRHDDD